MSAEMAEVIAAHSAMEPDIEDHPVHGYTDVACCDCGARRYLGMLGEPNDRDDLHAAHVAEELAKAGYGNVKDALLAAADEMGQERSTWCLDNSGRHWIGRTLSELRQRAHSLDPEGHALVKAIHDRKAEA